MDVKKMSGILEDLCKEYGVQMQETPNCGGIAVDGVERKLGIDFFNTFTPSTPYDGLTYIQKSMDIDLKNACEVIIKTDKSSKENFEEENRLIAC